MNRIIKKIVFLVITTMLVFTSVTPAGATSIPKNKNIQVLMDGRKIVFDGGDPYMDSSYRVQVPFRGIAESMGATLGYTGKKVTFKKGEKSIELILGSKIAKVDGKSVTMDTAATVKNGRTYVPLRFISENLGEPVRWDGEGNMVWIGEEKIYTYEDIAGKGEPISRYKSMYTGLEYLLKNAFDVPYKTVHVLTYEQLPAKIDHIIIYDIWEYSEDGKQYVGVRHSSAPPYIYFLTKNHAPKFRYADKRYLPLEDIRITRFEVIDYRDSSFGDSKPENFKLEHIEYVGFGYGEHSRILLKNPWK